MRLFFDCAVAVEAIRPVSVRNWPSYQMDNSIASAGNNVGSMPPQRKPVRTLKSPRSPGNWNPVAVLSLRS